MSNQRSQHGQWSSRFVFILAATGSAVGLGNIWKFPYMAGENGGGAFVLVYLLCIAVIGVPIMMGEILLGRRGRGSPVTSMQRVSVSESAPKGWVLLGFNGMLAGVLILSFYSVVAGWAMEFVYATASGQLADAKDGAWLDGLFQSPGRLLFWHSLFMVLTTVVIVFGVEKGLERAVKFQMPLLALMLLVLMGYSATTPGFAQGMHFLFDFDFSKLGPEAILAAMGQAFFSLSLGMGAIMVYGAYLDSEASIAKTSFAIAAFDTTVALVAGMAIFPLVYSHGLEPGAGPGLVFVTLPLAFAQMPAGIFLGTLFFSLLTLAAWTSAISLLEPVSAWFVERFGWTRRMAALVPALLIWALGVPCALSFNMLADSTIVGKTFFDLLDYATANVMLPLGGVLIALFVGWQMRSHSVAEELAWDSQSASFKIWLWLLRVVAPVAVMLIFLNAIGVLSF